MTNYEDLLPVDASFGVVTATAPANTVLSIS